MLSDVPPLPPCPHDKRGRHHLGAVLPGEDSGDMTLFCDACGALRRLPASGAVQVGGSLDDRAPDDIKRATSW